ncbi:hypothetical protein [Solibacillus isronensis]|uniref:hypothetical protein n=1 Tax=Solibacillus isronensis TaxID=412383 RepID=UPI00203BFE71|nr:hypothetical protein [Solibacillus isronensis]MCM3722471.1 hypothetical protein [Solibacillus isronensis]
MINSLIKSLDTFKGSIEIIVRDVGHGNWNEIRFGTTRIFFDIGAQKDWHENKVQNLVTAANIRKSENIYIFVSHWDVDHYHAILKLSDFELKQIKGFFAPERIPKTNTAERVKHLLNSAGIGLYLIPWTTKKHTDKRIELNMVFGGDKLKIFRSSKTNSRNLDSIVFYIETYKNSVMLTGDQKYEKLYDYIVSEVLPKAPMIFVLPHHGGNAGDFNISHWSTTSLEEVIISYHESNTYGHPLENNCRTAQSLLVCKPILSTNDTGDKVFLL